MAGYAKDCGESLFSLLLLALSVQMLLKNLGYMGLYGLCLLLAAGAADASAPPEQPMVQQTPTILGPLGLNTIPSARMDLPGTVRAGISTLDPYAHSYLGFQIAPPLYVQLRQSAEVSGLLDNADRLYPGVDVKLRLLEETGTRPEISLGLQSALGHKRMAGEYLVASKRYNDFDFTAGIGWGRYAGRGHILNPLKLLHDHFGKTRANDGEMPNEPGDWFTGRDIGLMAGVEYFTPITGLSLKADWGADDDRAEQAAFGFEAPAPWSAGVAYKPWDWMNLGIGIQGLDKIMARISFNTLLSSWKQAEKKEKPMLAPHRTGEAQPSRMEMAANNDGVILYNTRSDKAHAAANLKLDPAFSAPNQIGRAAVHMANNGGRTVEELAVTPTVMGLRGPAVKLIRGDFEKALIRHQGSADEIWRHAEFETASGLDVSKARRFAEVNYDLKDFRFVLDEQMSLSEEDSGFLTRTSLVAGRRGPAFFGLIDTGYAVRFNLHDTLDNIRGLRPRPFLPVRSDVDDFARNRIAVDELYAAFTHSFRSDLHLALLGGYLEEMYGGLGGELLYRPFTSRFAFGVEAWEALKREPAVPLAMGFNGDHLLSGHLNAWYDLPGEDLTLHAKFGRYLAEDIGGTLGVKKSFKNGASLETYVTVTDLADQDLFGGTTHADHGVRFTLPLGGYKYMPRQATIRVRAGPMGRDAGQALESPLPLYSVTEPFSYPHMIRHWDEVVP